MSQLEIRENAFGRVEIDRESRIVRLIRTANALTPESLETVVADFQLSVPLRERASLVVLQDMRLAPMVRDAALEQALLAAIPRLSARFAARAVLLATAVGRLQANRFASHAVGEVKTFTDEAEAMRYLREQAGKLRSA
jgi:hypothetical protein